MAAATQQPLILFDGECNLCTGSVQFVIKRDKKARYRFAALRSDAGKAALRAVLDPDGTRGEAVLEAMPDSIVLIQNGKMSTKSTAALAVARGIRWPWPLLSLFWIVPYPLRDFVYSWIARNRYRWFGKAEQCWVPTKELRARFLDSSEGG